MDIVESIDVVKGLIHSFIRFLPLGLYFFTYFSSTLYKDKRSIILLIGLIFNDIIGSIYKKYSGIVPNDTCAVFGNTDGSALNFLPNSHTEIFSFITSFFYSEMWNQGRMNWFKFNFLLFMMIITIWSRINIGCENSYQRIIFDLLFGMVRGSLFYHFFSSQYINAQSNDTAFEKAACDSNDSEYTCEKIQNGNVIIKDSTKKYDPKSISDDEDN
jgi:hypothetical protein